MRITVGYGPRPPGRWPGAEAVTSWRTRSSWGFKADDDSAPPNGFDDILNEVVEEAGCESLRCQMRRLGEALKVSRLDQV